MDTNNPLVWIIGFVLIFYVIGGGVFGGARYGAVEAVATNTSVGTRDLLDTMFAGFTGLGNQANQNFVNLKDQNTAQYFGMTSQISGLSDKLDRNRYDDLARENARLAQELQTAELKACFGCNTCC